MMGGPMYKLVYYGLNEASASIPGNSGIQGGSKLQIHIFQVPLEHLVFVQVG